MIENYYTPSIFETYNARHLSPERVAKSFVPPDKTYGKLATNNNNIITGPRGSGKTTLLKMLTLPALLSWDVEKLEVVQPKVDFVGIFVPADRGWASQIRQYGDNHEEVAKTVGRSAFCTHVLLSLCSTIDQFSLYPQGNKLAITQVPTPLDREMESALVDLIADEWSLRPRIQSIGGLKLALRGRLSKLKSVANEAVNSSDHPVKHLYDNAPFVSLDYRETLKFGIECYGEVTGNKTLNWGLLFDEFELAPREIQEDVILRLRGEEASYLVHKVALAPYNETFMSSIGSQDSSVRNDYEVIDLCYPRKKNALDFSEMLFQKNLVDRGLEEEPPQNSLGASKFRFEDDDENAPYAEDGYVTQAYNSLAKIDHSFSEYLTKQSIRLTDWGDLDESERAKIRKFRSIVITREYFRSKARNNGPARALNKTSRKIDTLYTGAPTILALCEGNPRILIGLISPILRELSILRQKSKKSRVAENVQAEQVRLSVNAFRALLKTVVSDRSDLNGQKGLLKLLDTIGRHFHKKCVVERFSPQPHLSFTVPSNADQELLTLLGRALNVGAIIYLPDRGADPILTSLKGKRFRLSYMLAAYYRLPIMINSAVSLSTIMGKASKEPTNGQQLGQVDLFDDYEALND